LKEILCFIYALVDPRDGRIRYVGKAKNIQERVKRHFKDRRTNQQRVAWFVELSVLGLTPEIKILESVQEGHSWLEAEVRWITEMRANGCELLNITCGGNEPPSTLAVIKKRSEKLKGHPVSAECRAKLSAWHTGRPLPESARKKLRQRKLSEQTRAKISASGIGRKHTEETKRVIAAASANMWAQPLHRELVGNKISKSRTGIRLSDATKEKLRAANLGKKHSEETRRKMSESHIAIRRNAIAAQPAADACL
jgi:hypothetical protein